MWAWTITQLCSEFNAGSHLKIQIVYTNLLLSLSMSIFFDSQMYPWLVRTSIQFCCMWDWVVDVVICLNRPKDGFHDICRRCKMLIVSINLYRQNYQHLTMSVYVLLCLCISEYHPLVVTAANHLDTACTSLLDMCRQCRAETVKIGQDTVALNWEIVLCHVP